MGCDCFHGLLVNSLVSWLVAAQSLQARARGSNTKKTPRKPDPIFTTHAREAQIRGFWGQNRHPKFCARARLAIGILSVFDTRRAQAGTPQRVIGQARDMSTTNQGKRLDLPLDTTPKRDGATDATRARALTVSAGFVTMEAH